MLYNKSTGRYTKEEIFKLDNLIAWLEAQDPTDEFIYTEPCECMCAQYFRAMGLPVFGVLPEGYHERDRDGCRIDGLHPYPKVMDMIAAEAGNTFGGALKVANKKRTWSWLDRLEWR